MENKLLNKSVTQYNIGIDPITLNTITWIIERETRDIHNEIS